MKLTGKTRYRVDKRFFGYKLVLQVEYESFWYDGFGGGKTGKSWRDATVEDLTVIYKDGDA